MTDVQLEADRFAVEKARKDLDTAESKLDILRKFTRVKMVNRLKAAVETSDARLRRGRTATTWTRSAASRWRISWRSA